MIDSPGQAMRLMSKLDAALPTFAGLSPELAAVVQKQSPGLQLPEWCRVTRVDYAGDEGGIVCWLDLGGQEQSKFVASITHLTFDRREVLAREIAAYKKHRIKRMHKRALLGLEPEEAMAVLRNFASAPRSGRGETRAPTGAATARFNAKAAS